MEHNTKDFEYFSSLFSYDKITGNLVRVKNVRSRAKAGDIVGTDHPDGYLSVEVDSKGYLVHRVVWLLYYGSWPDGMLDHADGNRKNNKITNLRLATRAQNSQNAKLRKDNSSGVKGVSWHKHVGKWFVRVQANGKRISVGYFDSFDEAVESAKLTRIKLHKEYSCER